MPQYVLLTAARNEERFLGETITSVLAQTQAPRKWVIVSDGSTDGTEALAIERTRACGFVEVISAARFGERDFGSKVAALKAAEFCLAGLEYDYLGILDADVSFEPTYFETLLSRMEARPRLGIAGGIITELIDGEFVAQRMSKDSVAGAVQTFRRSCWEAIGGYLPVRSGGIDAAAEITARARGFEVETFTDLPVRHLRRVSHGRGSILRERFRQGQNQFRLGYHPIFMLAKSLYRMSDRPLIAGGALMGLGYVWAKLSGEEKILPPDVIRALRKEQLDRLIMR